MLFLFFNKVHVDKARQSIFLSSIAFEVKLNLESLGAGVKSTQTIKVT